MHLIDNTCLAQSLSRGRGNIGRRAGACTGNTGMFTWGRGCEIKVWCGWKIKLWCAAGMGDPAPLSITSPGTEDRLCWMQPALPESGWKNLLSTHKVLFFPPFFPIQMSSSISVPGDRPGRQSPRWWGPTLAPRTRLNIPPSSSPASKLTCSHKHFCWVLFYIFLFPNYTSAKFVQPTNLASRPHVFMAPTSLWHEQYIIFLEVSITYFRSYKCRIHEEATAGGEQDAVGRPRAMSASPREWAE